MKDTIIPKGAIAKCNICGNELFRFELSSSFNSMRDWNIIFDLQHNRKATYDDSIRCCRCGSWFYHSNVDYYYNNEKL